MNSIFKAPKFIQSKSLPLSAVLWWLNRDDGSKETLEVSRFAERNVSFPLSTLSTEYFQNSLLLSCISSHSPKFFCIIQKLPDDGDCVTSDIVFPDIGKYSSCFCFIFYHLMLAWHFRNTFLLTIF